MTIVLSAYRIEKSRISDFLLWNTDVIQTVGAKVLLVMDKAEEFGIDWVNVLVYPKQQQQFSIAKTNNYGIKRVDSDIIIKSDVDIEFSVDVLRAVERHVCVGKGFVGLCADINIPHNPRLPWDKLTKRVQGKGALFALHKKDWFRLCGYNEKLYGWGADDNDIWSRSSTSQDMILSHEFPLYHINHYERKSRQPGSFFEFRSQQNLLLSKCGWYDENWGEAK